MVGAWNENEALGFGRGSSHLMQLLNGREGVAIAAEKKLWKGEIPRKRITKGVAGSGGRQAENDQSAQIAMSCFRFSGCTQHHSRAKTETCDDEREPEFTFQPIHPCEHITGLGETVVLTLAQTGAAKIKPQDRAAKPPRGIVQHLHGVVDNFVVQVAAAEGMGMADQRGKASLRRTLVQDGFQLAGGTGERKAADGAGAKAWLSQRRLLRRERSRGA